MRLKNIVAIFLLIIFAGRLAIGQDKKPKFYHIKAGEVASYDGYLLSPEAIAQIYSKTERDIKLTKLELNQKLELARIDIQSLKEEKELEKRVQAKLLEDTIDAKDQIIQNKILTIEKLERAKDYNDFFIVGSFIAGVVVASIVAYNVR